MASEACCKLAPVAHDYSPQGKYETIAGCNTYVTGSETASKGIIDIFDIFGLAPQTIQGADRLAAHTGAVVLVPDLFYGEPMSKDLAPADTDEKKQKMGAFISGPADLKKNLAKLIEIRKAVADKYPAAEGHWGVFGLCWGGKVAVLACAEGNEGAGRRFNVSGTAHPGFLAAEDAEAQTAPHILLASPDEPADLVAKYKEILAKPGKTGEVETYPGMFHGWMGARSDLKKEDNVKEFQRGYEQAAKFFSAYL